MKDIANIANIANDLLISPTDIVDDIRYKLFILNKDQLKSNYTVKPKIHDIPGENRCIDFSVSFSFKDIDLEIAIFTKVNEYTYSIQTDPIFIKRNIYNSLEPEIEDSKLKKYFSNIKYLKNLPQNIISERSIELLLNTNTSVFINEFRLESKIRFIYSTKNLNLKVSHKIILQESDEVMKNKFFYIGSINEGVFKKVLNNYLSEKYSLSVFGKKIDKLTKKEIEIIDITLY